MYKTRNTGTENGMRGTQGMRRMLYSRECPQTFQGMSPNILGNVPNILGNVLKHCGECRQTFRGISPNISENVPKHCEECSQMIQKIFENNLGHVVKHPVERMKAFGWMYIIVLNTGDRELYLFTEEPFLLNSRKIKGAHLKAVFHSVKIFARADFLELKILRGKI